MLQNYKKKWFRQPNKGIKNLKNYKIRKLRISDINNFLVSRNLIFNRNLMINKKKINNINHYIWWFTNLRESFVMDVNKTSSIFFWHKLEKIGKKKVFVGGWHSNTKGINLYFVLYCLKWQLRYLKNRKLNYEWVAVIKKQNSAVQILTRMLGYREIKNNERKYYNLVKKIFNVSKSKYIFLKLSKC